MVYDVIIIGGGIIGSFLAHDLSKREGNILLLEKESDIANETTMANSAIIHSGHDPKDGTLKARLNLEGNRMYPKIAEEMGFSYKQISAFVAAVGEEEEAVVDTMFETAKKREIPAFLLSGDEAREKEPNLGKKVGKVLELPTTGIIYPWEVAYALMEEAMINGTQLKLNHEVIKIQKEEEVFLITAKDKTNQEETVIFKAKTLINATGVYGDQIHVMAGGDPEAFRIRARRGEYYVLDKLPVPLVSRIIYPVPSKVGKGVLAVPTIHGNLLVGPDATFVEEREDNQSTKEALDYIRETIGKTVENVPFHKVIRTFSGLRATGSTGDFCIEESGQVPGMVNVIGMESPALASAPAISKYVMEEVLPKTAGYVKGSLKETYKKRVAPIVIEKLSLEEYNELVKKQPEYGHMICRCEQISEGEILDAIRGPLGATTVKGIKKRVRPGMGRCQGGFCEPRVIEILAREKGLRVEDIRLDGPSSQLLVEELTPTVKKEGEKSAEMRGEV